MKLAIIGSRDFTDYSKLEDSINKYFRDLTGVVKIDKIISGGLWEKNMRMTIVLKKK